MSKWSAIEMFEEHNFRNETYNFENPQATVRLRCAYANYQPGIKDLLLYHRPYPFNTSTLPKLYASSVRIVTDNARFEPAAGDLEARVPSYDALLDVMYTPLYGQLHTALSVAPDNRGYLYVEEELEPQIDFISFEYKQFFWKKLNQSTDENGEPTFELSCEGGEQWDHGSEGGWPLKTLTLKRTVHGYNTLPTGWHLWEGKTHSAAFTSVLHPSFATEANTILFTNPRVERKYSNYYYNTPTYSLSAELRWQPQGWNKFPKLVEDLGTVKVEFEGACVIPTKNSEERFPYEPYEESDMSAFIFSSHTYTPTTPT